MSIKKTLLLITALFAAAFVLAACAGPAGSAGLAGPAGPVGPQGETGPIPLAADLSCTACHNDTTLLTGKEASWGESLHGTGVVFLEDGGNKSCAGCHSGGGFTAMIAAGLTPVTVEAGDPNPTRQDCRACHQIHTTYTIDDFALETTAPVTLFTSGQTFDGGMGNLCANCHQARKAMTAVVDGKVDVTARFGPHHGPQSDMLLGIGGAGAVTGTPSMHATTVENTCVTCHMGGDAANHSFAPNVATCVTCHTDATTFDINGVQTEVDGKIATLKTALTTAGLLDAQGAIVAGKYDEAKANALWNYIFVTKEDKSRGVHNSAYTIALLDASLAVFAP